MTRHILRHILHAPWKKPHQLGLFSSMTSFSDEFLAVAAQHQSAQLAIMQLIRTAPESDGRFWRVDTNLRTNQLCTCILLKAAHAFGCVTSFWPALYNTMISKINTQILVMIRHTTCTARFQQQTWTCKGNFPECGATTGKRGSKQ